MPRTENIQQMIIKLLGNRDLHGYDIHKELESRGMKIGIGRLYEILKQMYKDGFLNDIWKQSESGPKKRIYSLNSKGQEAREAILMEAIHTVHEFYGEYLRNMPPEKSAFMLIANRLAENFVSDVTIAYVAMKSTKPIKALLSNLRLRLPEATLYVVGPRNITSELEMELLPSLEGSCHSIPAKNEYFDLVVLIAFSESEDLASCIHEWHRVLKPTGRVVIITPTALLKQQEDLLSIGEFIEQREHPSSIEEATVSGEDIQSTLENYFGKIDTDLFLHLTIISASKPL